MNALLNTMFRNAEIATPVADAANYVARREADNAALGDISKLDYVKRDGKKWVVAGKRYSTEIEARAACLRCYW